jgi:hypothetical protein
MSMNGVTSTWGPQGLVADRSLSALMVTSARQWFTGEIDLGQLRAVAAVLPQRKHISMVVNNECNLKCKHCFLQLPGLSRNRLTSDEWKQVLASSITEDIGQYVIAGKEPLVGTTGPEVIDWLGTLRAKSPCIRTGIVTNGTLLHNHESLIRNADLSHMDISIDGCEADHDAIRGPGAFAKMRNNVEWASDLMGERLFVTMTLQKRNLERIDQALLAFSDMGVRSVGISAFEQLPYNDNSLALSSADLKSFFANLQRIERLGLPNGMFVQTDACIAEPLALLAFIESPWFDLDSMQMDGTGFLYSRHQLANGITLSIRFLPWPMSLESSVRITADGELISVEDARHPRTHHENSLANVRDFGLDFGAAFRAATVHPRYALQDARYEAELGHLVRAAYRRQQDNRQAKRAKRAA